MVFVHWVYWLGAGAGDMVFLRLVIVVVVVDVLRRVSMVCVCKRLLSPLCELIHGGRSRCIRGWFRDLAD